MRTSSATIRILRSDRALRWSPPGLPVAVPISTARPGPIPAKSKVREEAWQLAKFLSSPRQLLEDGIRSEAIETSSLSVLYSPEFDRHFRADLLSAVRQSRAVAFEERPFGTLGIEACIVVGDAVNAAVERRAGVERHARADPRRACRACGSTDGRCGLRSRYRPAIYAPRSSRRSAPACPFRCREGRRAHTELSALAGRGTDDPNRLAASFRPWSNRISGGGFTSRDVPSARGKLSR